MDKPPAQSDESPQTGMEYAENAESGDGQPEKLVTMTLHGAAAQCGFERTTLRSRLLESGQKPDRKRRYTLRQIILAMLGDAKKTKAQILQEQLRGLVNENDEAEGMLLPADFFRVVLFKCHAAIAARIRASSMSSAEKDNVLADLARLAERDFCREAREDQKKRV